MFVPGTVAARVQAAGGSLDPEPTDPGTDRWQVTPDIGLFHWSAGGGEDVVYVHGGPGYPPRAVPSGLDSLARTHRVHVFHARGCGRSTRPFDTPPAGALYEQIRMVEGRLGLAEQIADIERIRRRLGCERLTLMGHSFGALVAALYAAEFPERVRALVLVSPAPLDVMPTPGPDLFALVGQRLPPEAQAEWRAYLRSYFDLPGGIQLGERGLAARYTAFAHWYGRATASEATLDARDVGGYLTLGSYSSLGQRHDWRAALGRIRARAVVLHGAADIVPEGETRRFASAIPGAEVQVIADAGHFLPEDAPSELVAAVERAESAAK